jgi:uncharacterized protein YcaQ
MRAPARAQDLILAQRVKGYRAGELERCYPRLAIEEAFFVNYGFLPRETLALLHPREAPRAKEVLAFVRQHGCTHPKDVQAHFDHGRIKRWGGDLNVSTHLLEGLHYRGVLRVARREAGTRIYQAIEHTPQDNSPEARLARAGQLLDTVVQLQLSSVSRLEDLLVRVSAACAPFARRCRLLAFYLLRLKTENVTRLARERLADRIEG